MSDAPLRIGITCFPTTGGSGIIATEIGLALAERGHHVHFICYDLPARLLPPDLLRNESLTTHSQRLSFHRVVIPDYPLPHLGAYPLALASSLAQVSAQAGLELLHLHYAVPHATSALLARELLNDQGQQPPRVITTLHGTDITQVGSDPALVAMTRLSLKRCDGLTAPSHFLAEMAHHALGLPSSTRIAVIPNFVDTAHFVPPPQSPLPREPLLFHSSNFRPLKRLEDVIHILQEVRKQLPARLLLVGDGPERSRIEQLVQQLGLSAAVSFLGMHRDLVPWLQRASVFLLPSSTEGFGLAALEALSCGVPVVASRVGGLPEVIHHGKTGFLFPPGDIPAMAAAATRLLFDHTLRAQMSHAARSSVERHWQRCPAVSRYEAYYRQVLRRQQAPNVTTCTSSRPAPS